MVKLSESKEKMSEKFILSYTDYAVLCVFLAISGCIALYFSIFGRKQKTNNDYLLAGKDMSIFPVSFSLMATFISVTTLIGIPTDMYLFGTDMAFMCLGFTLGPIIAVSFFIPIYFHTGVSTPFEYLEKRFGKTTNKILSVIFLVQTILYSGLSLYAPALALSAVTNISMWVSVITVASVGIFYSTIGGMKAVIWTEMYQAVLMYTCLISIIVKGLLDLGGIQSIFKTAYDGKRIFLPTFKMDFHVRYTIWSILLQGFIITTCCFACEQVLVQRQLTLKNLKRSFISTLLSIPMIVIFQLLCCLCGIIFYVYFQKCDPVSSAKHAIESYDQLMPYYIVSVMRDYPGLPGLCIAGIFSVSLSVIASHINSMAAVTYQDIIRPMWKDLKRDVLITKIANFFYGAISIVVVLLVSSMGNLAKACILILGLGTGPVLGVFFLASLTTTANEMGVNIGVIAGFLLGGFLTFIPNERQYPTLPIENNCTDNAIGMGNISISVSTDSQTAKSTTFDQTGIFSISFMWISPLAMLTCLVIGYIASWIVSYSRGKSKQVPTELLSPLRQQFCVKESQKDISRK